jgi:uncharacterized membrane protein HdeD (DUF308 family)
MDANTEITHRVRWSIVWSVAMIMAGALAIIVPPATDIDVMRLVSWLLVFSGATHLAYAWRTRGSGGFWMGIVLGINYMAAGAYIWLHPLAGLRLLILVLLAYLFVESSLEFILAYQLQPLVGSSWLRFDGLITLILSILLASIVWIAWPFSATWVIGVLVGISMLFSGVARLMVSLAPRRVAEPPHGESHEME